LRLLAPNEACFRHCRFLVRSVADSTVTGNLNLWYLRPTVYLLCTYRQRKNFSKAVILFSLNHEKLPCDDTVAPEAKLFDFSSPSQFARESSPRVVATRRERQGIEARQRDIYDSHRHRAFALAYYMTGNEIEAEHILTSTFVRAFRDAQEPDGRAVDTALLRELRQRSHLQPEAAASATTLPADPCDSAAELADRNVKRTDLEEAVRDLPAIERLIFLLRDVEGYSPAAIADLLEVPQAQVQRDLFAARLRLRRVLAEAQAGEQKKAA
jgi:RNA polymerase sigma-70 factor, ECF subfamily